MKFDLIRISTTTTNTKNDKKNEKKPTYIVNNRDFIANKMLFWISTVLIWRLHRAVDYNRLGKLREQPNLGT
jgi:hypothetical protein